jgi:hypothetical protein
MNTYQRQLLDKLITELTDNASPNLHAAQMLAAELNGAMHAQIIGDDQSAPQIDTPTLDADGWVENCGVDPKCMITAWRLKDGYELHRLRDSRELYWRLDSLNSTITHYRPA